MVKKSSNPGYVTVDECKRITRSFRNDMGILKTALVGGDLRGGLVKDVSDIKNQVRNISNSKNGNGWTKKDYAIIIASVFGSGGLGGLIVALINSFA